MDQEKKKSVWDNTKLILKKIGDAGSKMGKSLEKYDTSKNPVKKQKEFDINDVLKKLPQ